MFDFNNKTIITRLTLGPGHNELLLRTDGNLFDFSVIFFAETKLPEENVFLQNLQNTAIKQNNAGSILKLKKVFKLG